MKRDFQIRITGDNEEDIDCLCFENLAEANEAYNKGLQDDTEGSEYIWELVEVLRQDSVCGRLWRTWTLDQSPVTRR